MPDPSMRDQLLALETHTPELKQKYEQELKTMFEKPLTRLHRIAWLGVLAFHLIMPFLLFYYAFGDIFTRSNSDLVPMLLTFTIVGVSLKMLVQTLRIVWRGYVDLRSEMTLSYALKIIGCMSFVYFVLFLIPTLPRTYLNPDFMMFQFAVIFVLVYMATGSLFANRAVERSEMKMKEQMLQMKLEISELRETLGQKKEA